MMQGTIQGALYGARALAQGTGPIIFAAIFAAFTREESPFPKFAGEPCFAVSSDLHCAVSCACAAAPPPPLTCSCPALPCPALPFLQSCSVALPPSDKAYPTSFSQDHAYMLLDFCPFDSLTTL